MICLKCQDSGWLCEHHQDRPWSELVPGTPCCDGDGIPCVCNADLHLTGFEGGAIIASVEPIPDGQRVH